MRRPAGHACSGLGASECQFGMLCLERGSVCWPRCCADNNFDGAWLRGASHMLCCLCGWPHLGHSVRPMSRVLELAYCVYSSMLTLSQTASALCLCSRGNTQE